MAVINDVSIIAKEYDIGTQIAELLIERKLIISIMIDIIM